MKKTRLGEWLRLNRGELGWSLRRAAEEAGVSHVYLSEIEKGAKLCSAERALLLGKALVGHSTSEAEAYRLWILDRDEQTRDEADAAWKRRKK
jgi:transcriptional regulator with XRE-family HTH domain